MSGSIPSIPDLYYEFALNADPNQVAVPPYFLDWSGRAQFGWSGGPGGAQYELDTTESGTLRIELANPDGALDPGNAASPYWPNLIPYRRMRIRCVLGVNLLWPDQGSAMDWSAPSDGRVPPWLAMTSPAGYALTTATVGASAYVGTRVFALAVPASSGTRGLAALAVPFVVAGQSYTWTLQGQCITAGQSPAVYVSVEWLSASGSVVSSVSSSPVTLTGAAGTWSQVTVSGVAPATAVAARLSMNTTSTTTGAAVVWMGGLQLEPRGYATRWQMPWRTGVNLFPQNIGTGLETMNPVADLVTNWFNVQGNHGGTLARATNMAIAAPTGSTTAVAWTTLVGSTSANAVMLVGDSSAVSRPVMDTVQVVGNTAYTVSAYMLRAASADATVAVKLSLTWYDAAGVLLSTVLGSSSTLGTGAWVRPTVGGTSPATAAFGRVSVAITTPATTTATNVVSAAGWQFEQAAAATTWADPGVTAFLYSGMVERWPNTWNEEEGTYGTAPLECVDDFAGLAQFPLDTPFINEVMALSPTFFYTLADPADSIVCVDRSGIRPPAPVENAPQGGPGIVFGSAIASTNPVLAFEGTAGPVATFANAGNLLGAPGTQTYVALHRVTAVPGPARSGAWSRLIAFRTSVTPDINHRWTIWEANVPAGSGLATQLSIRVENTAVGPLTVIYKGTTGATLAAGSAGSVTDGNWHLVVVVVDPGTGTGTAYMDGVSIGTIGGLTAPSGVVTDAIGTEEFGSASANGFTGDLALAAELPVALTATQVTNLYNSWRTASTGESSGARFTRALSWMPWFGRTAVDTGSTTSMGPATDLAGQNGLAGLEAITETEGGTQYVSGAGVLTFKGRGAFYGVRTPVAVFGEGPPVGGYGEWPVEIAGFDFDPSRMAMTAEVTQYQGPTVTSTNASALVHYFPRKFTRAVNVTSVNEAVDAATYYAGQLSVPHKRAEVITLHPSAVMGLWPVVAQLEKTDRIRAWKRPVGAAATTLELFVQKMVWAMAPGGDATVSIQGSPADLVAYWVLAALHTTLNLQAASGQNKATINALPDAAVNKLVSSLPSGSLLTFEPGTARAETMTLAAGGIPATALGYTTAQLTFTGNFAFTHAVGTVVCEPLPAGYVDPTTWDASSVLGAAYARILAGAANSVTVATMPDSTRNALGSNWNVNDTVWVSAGTANAELMTILSVAPTSPGYTSCTIVFTANFALSHNGGEYVSDSNALPASLAPTTRLAY